MYQQHSIRRLDILRAPRVGLGLLGVAMLAAFVTGIVIATVVVSAQLGPVGSATAVAQPVPVVGPAPLNPQDFGAPPLSGASDVRAAPVTQSAPYLAPVNVQDFGAPPPAGGYVRSGHAPLNVQDFGTPPRADAP